MSSGNSSVSFGAPTAALVAQSHSTNRGVDAGSTDSKMVDASSLDPQTVMPAPISKGESTAEESTTTKEERKDPINHPSSTDTTTAATIAPEVSALVAPNIAFAAFTTAVDPSVKAQASAVEIASTIRVPTPSTTIEGAESSPRPMEAAATADNSNIVSVNKSTMVESAVTGEDAPMVTASSMILEEQKQEEPPTTIDDVEDPPSTVVASVIADPYSDWIQAELQRELTLAWKAQQSMMRTFLVTRQSE